MSDYTFNRNATNRLYIPGSNNIRKKKSTLYHDDVENTVETNLFVRRRKRRKSNPLQRRHSPKRNRRKISSFEFQNSPQQLSQPSPPNKCSKKNIIPGLSFLNGICKHSVDTKNSNTNRNSSTSTHLATPKITARHHEELFDIYSNLSPAYEGLLTSPAVPDRINKNKNSTDETMKKKLEESLSEAVEIEKKDEMKDCTIISNETGSTCDGAKNNLDDEEPLNRYNEIAHRSNAIGKLSSTKSLQKKFSSFKRSQSLTRLQRKKFHLRLNAYIEVKWQERWWKSKIIRLEPKRFRVHYLGFHSDWDHWIDHKEFDMYRAFVSKKINVDNNRVHQSNIIQKTKCGVTKHQQKRRKSLKKSNTSQDDTSNTLDNGKDKKKNKCVVHQKRKSPRRNKENISDKTACNASDVYNSNRSTKYLNRNGNVQLNQKRNKLSVLFESNNYPMQKPNGSRKVKSSKRVTKNTIYLDNSNMKEKMDLANIKNCLKTISKPVNSIIRGSLTATRVRSSTLNKSVMSKKRVRLRQKYV